MYLLHRYIYVRSTPSKYFVLRTNFPSFNPQWRYGVRTTFRGHYIDKLISYFIFDILYFVSN